MALSQTGGSPDTRQEGGGAGPAPCGGLCEGQRACPRFPAGEPDAAGLDRGDRPSGPGHGRTTPSREHCASGRRVGRGGQHRRQDRHGARDKNGESVTSRLGPCRTSVSGRRNARAHRGRRSSCTLRNGGLSIGNLGHLPDPPLWRVEAWRKRRDISLPGYDSNGLSEPTVECRRWDCRSARCNPIRRPWFGSRQSHVRLSSA